MGCQNHSRCAVATLNTVCLDEGLLDGMKGTVFRQALHGQYLLSIDLYCEEQAGLDESAIQNDRAGAALSDYTPNVGPG